MSDAPEDRAFEDCLNQLCLSRNLVLQVTVWETPITEQVRGTSKLHLLLTLGFRRIWRRTETRVQCCKDDMEVLA